MLSISIGGPCGWLGALEEVLAAALEEIDDCEGEVVEDD
jgi:hypothetical protein